MINKVSKIILILYNICGLALMVLAGAGMAPPVGWVPRPLVIVVVIPFVLLLIAHLIRYLMRRNNKMEKSDHV